MNETTGFEEMADFRSGLEADKVTLKTLNPVKKLPKITNILSKRCTAHSKRLYKTKCDNLFQAEPG